MICSSCEALTIDRLYARAGEPVNTRDRTRWNRNGYLELHSSYQSLQTAARNGCTNCLSFHENFVTVDGGFESLKKRLAVLAGSQDSPVPIITYLNFGTKTSKEKSPISSLSLQVGTEIANPSVNSLILTFKIIRPRVLSKNEADLQYDFQYIEIEKDLWHDQNFAIARDWIQECTTNHDKAICPPIDSKDLPTRLIDVYPKDHPGEPRLVLPIEGEKGRYLALSHCWGPSISGERLMTTKATLKSRLESIPLSTMPSTFLDAMIITRRLGYRYLWIDSLCIIQDSREDWETESGNMGNIYTNASLTLAAGAAKDSDGGMLGLDHRCKDTRSQLQFTNGSLQERMKINDQQQMAGSGNVSDSKKRLQCHFKLQEHRGSSVVILEPAVKFPEVEEGWSQCAVDGPLARRGWCLQERLLSHRMLYYGERQIYWQCASSRKAADGGEIPEGRSDSSQAVSNELSEWPDLLGLKQLQCSPINKRTGLAQPKDGAEIEKMAYKIWRNVIYLSTNRQLTKQTDQLPALAGMAQIIYNLTGDTFLAGFWRKDLLISLIWSSSPFMFKEVDYSVINRRMKKPQWEHKEPWLEGPSWSWVSVSSAQRLQFCSDHEEGYSTRVWLEYEAQIMEAEVAHIGKLVFGEVRSGRLRLRGYTYRRYDSRTSGWNPAGSISWVILRLCPQSPWNRDKHKLHYDRVYWDYIPRQKYSSVLRLLLHILFWLFNVLTMSLWWRYFPNDKDLKTKTLGCPACMEYVCIHLLSIGSKKPSSNGHEIVMWALILEPVPGKRDVYRRIGTSNQRVFVSEREFCDMADLKLSGMVLPEPFAPCELRTVEII